MKLLETFSELVKQTYGLFFPTSKDKREEFLQKVREKVDYYQPKIEERCNISIGDVKVKDNCEWNNDVLYGVGGIAWKHSIESAWKKGRVPNKFDFILHYSVAGLTELLLKFPIFMYNTFVGAEMRHHNHTIYVPFYYVNRLTDFLSKSRIRYLDYFVVHELSHSVWDELSGGQEYPLFERGWIEGFTTYCADIHFADLYPEGMKKFSDSDLPKLYVNGRKKIEELVNKYGNEIVLEIPSRWKEFK